MLGLNEVSLAITYAQPSQFVELCGAIVLTAAGVNNIEVTGFSWNLNIAEPDGGIDARMVDFSGTIPRLVPYGKTAYQCKAGDKAGSAKEIAEKDILEKPGVMTALTAGAHFVYFAGRDRSEKFEDEIVSVLETNNLQDVAGRIHYIGPTALAGMLLRYPGLAYRYLGLTHECYSHEAWSKFESMSNPLVTVSPDFDARMQALSQRFDGRSRFTEVYGAAGNGKTRLVLEAIRTAANGTAQNTLYTSSFAEAHKLLQSVAKYPNPRVLLVADDLEPSEIRQLRDRHPAFKGEIHVVAIGLDCTRSDDEGVFAVPLASREVIEAIVTEVAAGLPAEALRRLSELCVGSPKLAVMLARIVDANPAVLTNDLLRNPHAEDAIDRLIGKDWTSAQQGALRAVALFSRLGWEGEVESELQLVLAELGLDYSDSREWLETIHKRHGIVPTAGRYRYLSPDLLADFLAAKLIDNLPPDRFHSLISSLTEPMLVSFARRLQRIGRSVRHQRVIEEVLGPLGPYKSLDDLKRDGPGRLLISLAPVFPGLIVALLQRLTAQLDPGALSSHLASRRVLVWCTQHIVWLEEFFEDAARVLYRLAEAENESWGNNATGVWLELFQTRIGRTQASPTRRLAFLRSLYVDASAEGRVLIFKALGRALKLRHLSRMGMPPDELPGSPVKEWAPATHDQLLDAMKETLQTLIECSEQTASDERAFVAEALLEGVDQLFLGSADLSKLWFEAAGTLVTASFEAKKPLITFIETQEWRQTREGAIKLDATLMEELRDLRARMLGSSELEQLKATLTGAEWNFDPATFKLKLRPLLPLALDPGFFIRERQFLERDASYRALMTFVRELGALDADRILYPCLFSLAKASPIMESLLMEYVQSLDDETVWADLRAKVAEATNKPELWPLKFSVIAASDFSETVLEDLIDSVSDPAAQEHVSRLRYVSWFKDMRDEDLGRLIRAIGPRREAITLLCDRLHERKGASQPLVDVIASLLVTSNPENDLDEYYWTQLGSAIVTEASDLVLTAFFMQPTRVNFHSYKYRGEQSRASDTEELISRAWRLCDQKAILHNVVRPLLESDVLISFVTRSRLRFLDPKDEDAPSIMDWVRESSDTRVAAAAYMAGEPMEHLTVLQKSLLEEFPDEAGSALYGQLIEGLFSGPLSKHWGRKIERAENWIQSNSTGPVHDFAKKVIRALTELRDRELRDEAEEELEP